MEAFVEMLVEMGYEKGYAEQAVKATNSSGIEAALDWIAEHPNEPGPSQSTEESSAPVVRSYVCEECGKKLRNDDEMQFHSAKSGHCSFSESSEKVKALTEEEKKAKMEALRAVLEEKKKRRLEEQKQKEIEDEKQRRDQGKKLLNAKQEFKEKMERLEAEEIKKQKVAEKAHRAQVLAEIERDRAERRARQNGYSSATTSAVPEKSNSTSATVMSEECRLQIRTPYGAPLKSTFKSTDKLFDVLQYVCNNWPDEPNGLTRSVIDSEGVTLQTTFPTRKFTEKDQSSTLQELGLCPSSVIMANRTREGKRKEIEDEKQRRDQGKKLLNAKQEFKEKMKRLEAEEIKKEKAAEKAQRAWLLAEIEGDRAERRIRRSGYVSATTPAIPEKSNSTPATALREECHLQIRTPYGAPLKSTFKSTDKLFDVLQYVCNNWPDEPNGLTRSVIDSEGVTLQTTFPTRKFTEKDQSSTLQELGLCPSSVIMANRL